MTIEVGDRQAAQDQDPDGIILRGERDGLLVTVDSVFKVSGQAVVGESCPEDGTELGQVSRVVGRGGLRGG